MATKLICPDCGGIIGECTDKGEVPCTCIHEAVAPAVSDYKPAGGGSTAGIESPVETGLKICRVCGKNVEGEKRYKDSLGYWCLACHKAEKASQVAGKKRCTECGRMIDQNKLIECDTERLCYTCNRNRNAQRRQILRKAAKGRVYRLQEQKQLLVLLGIFLVLLLIIGLRQLGWIGG